MYGTVTGIGSPTFNPFQTTSWGLAPYGGQQGWASQSSLSPIQQQAVQLLQLVPQQLQNLQQIAYVQQQQLQQIQQALQQLAQIVSQQLQPYGLPAQVHGALGLGQAGALVQAGPQFGQQFGQQAFPGQTSHVM